MWMLFNLFEWSVLIHNVSFTSSFETDSCGIVLHALFFQKLKACLHAGRQFLPDETEIDDGCRLLMTGTACVDLKQSPQDIQRQDL